MSCFINEAPALVHVPSSLSQYLHGPGTQHYTQHTLCKRLLGRPPFFVMLLNDPGNKSGLVQC